MTHVVVKVKHYISTIIPVLTEAIKEQQLIIEHLLERVAALESR